MRYQRQILLSEIGEQGQKKLQSAKVLVVGAGGLGHPAIQYLVAMGVGQIGVIDGDVVSETNLHRQVLFNSNDIEKNKAEVIKEYFQKRNESHSIKPYNLFLNKKIALDLFPEYDVIIDGTDNFETKFLINDVCCLYDKPMVYGSISQFEGQVSVFWKRYGPCYRCLVKQKPLSKIQNCAEAGVVGILPGIIGAMQAMETLKVLLKDQNSNTFKPLIGRISVFNFLDNTTLNLNLARRKNCLCQCENLKASGIEELTVQQCRVQSANELIDVRELDELTEFNIPGVRHWPLSKLLQGEFPPVAKDEKLIAICKSGVRAEKASEILKTNGYLKVSFTKESIYGYQAR